VLKDLVRFAARGMGLELHRYIPSRSYSAQLHAMIIAHQIDLVFDVGANTGQFGRELRKHIGYQGTIVSFEPTAKAYQKLIANARGDEKWIIANRCAIGSTEGFVNINVSANSVSSSVLPMLNSHVDAAPSSRYVSTEKVPLYQLDALAPLWIDNSKSSMIKIDTQGFESEVLKGAIKTLSQAQGLQLELSIVPLYEGQKLMPELMAEIKEMGFSLWGMFPAFCDESNGRLLQVDATFFRGKVTNNSQ
jgi:FkbM family methyltransferase